MARRQVVEIQCSRCERKEMRESARELNFPPQDGEAPWTQFRAELKLSDEKLLAVVFEDLCTPCQSTVASLVAQIGKKIEGLSPDRKLGRKAKKESPAATAAELP